MKEKKNIDRIFQEKFKDFESEPREKVWENIASKLDKKEKKRPLIIPLWLKLGGVAAVLAIILASILFTNTQGSFTEEREVVFDETEESTQNEGAKNAPKIENKKVDPREQVASEDIITKSREESSASNNRSSSSNSAIGKIKNEPAPKRSSKEKIQPSEKNKTAIAAEDLNPSKKKNEKDELAIIPGIISNEKSSNIAQIEKVKVDSTKTASILEEENALAQVEEEKNKNKEEEEILAEVDTKKMRLSTFAAPVFYKNIGSGNELSNQFSNNASSSEVTFSYGVKVAYKISKKLKIRTGISKVNMSYNIQDISYSPSARSAGFENIRPNEDNLNIRGNSSPAAELDNGLPMEGLGENSFAASVFTPGEINQQFGYIEVPIELEYAILDKKFGLNIIGGGSSLFLDNNRVQLISEQNKTDLGEATNINSTSFSTNIGVGMDYKLTDKFSITVEPIFKYQINTFNNVDNVQPVNFGIYSGLSFKF